VIELLEEKKLLKKKDFIVTENYHSRLKENTAKLLIEKIKSNFNRKTENYKRGKSYSYQNILFDNIQQLANFIMGKNKEMKSNIPLIRIQRNGFLEIQQKIMNMTPANTEKLGINKCTLWYQKQKILQGNKSQLYRKTPRKLS
jgi:CRISPR-associated protein Cas1